MANEWYSSTAENLKGEREASRQNLLFSLRSLPAIPGGPSVDRIVHSRTFSTRSIREDYQLRQLRRRLQSKPKPATSRYKEYLCLCAFISCPSFAPLQATIFSDSSLFPWDSNFESKFTCERVSVPFDSFLLNGIRIQIEVSNLRAKNFICVFSTHRSAAR